MKNVVEHDLSIDDTIKWTFVLVCLVLLIVSLSWGSDKYTSSSSGFTVADSNNKYVFYIENNDGRGSILYVKNRIRGQDILVKQIDGDSAKLENDNIIVLTEGFLTNREDVYSLITGEKIEQRTSRPSGFVAFLPALLLLVVLVLLV